MTGLYPASHGITGNSFWDPALEGRFVHNRLEDSFGAEWWWGEPIWGVVERAGRIAGNIMWYAFSLFHSGVGVG